MNREESKTDAGAVSSSPSQMQVQPPRVTRTDLQRHALSISGFETIQVRVDLAPAAFAARHWHPGEEVIYVLAGTLKYQIDGETAVILKAGEVFFVPAGAIHSAANVGSDIATELATYIVKEGKPLVTLA